MDIDISAREAICPYHTANLYSPPHRCWSHKIGRLVPNHTLTEIKALSRRTQRLSLKVLKRRRQQ